jgi:hypothetical protein
MPTARREFKCRFCCSVAIWFCFGAWPTPDCARSLARLTCLPMQARPISARFVLGQSSGPTTQCTRLTLCGRAQPCHNNNGTLCPMAKANLVQCPCKPAGNSGMPEHIEGPCPLGLVHPPSGVRWERKRPCALTDGRLQEEFALGCGLCRNIKDF